MTGIASTLKSRSPRTDPGARARERAYACEVCERARLQPRVAHARVGVSAFLRRPGSALTLTTLPARPCARLKRTAALNYLGSMALTRKAPIRCQRAFGCARAPFHC